MCGIVGTVKYRDKEILHKMNEIQVHRGPDSQGVFWSEELFVGLAMRRLSIVIWKTVRSQCIMRIGIVPWYLMVKFLMQIFSEKSY